MKKKSDKITHQNIPAEVRRYVRGRDKFCRLCGHVGNANNPLTIHHMIFDQNFHGELVGAGINRNNSDYLTLLCHLCHQAFHKDFSQRN